MSRLPRFLTQVSPIGETLAAVEHGIDLMTGETARRNAQLAASSADDSLHLWEADYALKHSGTTAQRRARIRTVMAGSQTLSRERLMELASTVGEADACDVWEDFPAYAVTLAAIWEGRTPGSCETLERIVEKRKPAHLKVDVLPCCGETARTRRHTALTGCICTELFGRCADE